MKPKKIETLGKESEENKGPRYKYRGRKERKERKGTVSLPKVTVEINH